MLKALLSHFQKFKTLASRSLDPFRKVKRHQGEALSLEESQSSPMGGRFVSVSRDRTDHSGACGSNSNPARSLPAGAGRTGGTDAGVRHVHGRLGAEVTGGCGGTGVLQDCESGVGLKF